LTPHRGFYIYAAVFLLMLLLDQGSKAWVRGEFSQHQRLTLIPKVFEITLTYNEGIAFGYFRGAGVLFAPIAILIAVGSGWYSLRHRQEKTFSQFALGMLAAGAIGNLIDRVWLGKVTDMFYIVAINFPVFNWADTCITISAILLAFRWIFDRGPQQADPAPVEPTLDA
jgi:signal peptidase II